MLFFKCFAMCNASLGIRLSMKELALLGFNSRTRLSYLLRQSRKKIVNLSVSRSTRFHENMDVCKPQTSDGKRRDYDQTLIETHEGRVLTD